MTTSKQISDLATQTKENQTQIDLKQKEINEFHQNNLDQMEQQKKEYEELKTKVESLLPGATTANLASAFKARKVSFVWQKIIWALLCVGSILVLGWIGYKILNTGTINTITDLLFYILKRTPVLAAFILLEEFSRRSYNISLRLEEDYGYKEVLSKSFVGYRKQMNEIIKDSSESAQKLSNNVLLTLSESPGRLIDREKPIETPISDYLDIIPKLIKEMQSLITVIKSKNKNSNDTKPIEKK